jgi:hypothetical protein
MSNLVPAKSNIVTVLVIQASIFNWTYLRCDWWCIDKTKRVILHICCQMQPNSPRLCYVNSGPSQIKHSYIFCYSGINIQRISADIGDVSTIEWALYSAFPAQCSLNPPDYAMSTLVRVKSNIFTVLLIQASIFPWTYHRCDWWFIDKPMRVILHNCCHIKHVSSCLRYVYYGLGQIKYIYISWYSSFSIQLNVSPSILVICRQTNARYTPHSHPNTGHNMRFTLSQLWSRSNPI